MKIKTQNLLCNKKVCKKKRAKSRPCILISNNSDNGKSTFIALTSKPGKYRPSILTFENEQSKISYINYPIVWSDKLNKVDGEYKNPITNHKVLVNKKDAIAYFNKQSIPNRIFVLAMPFKTEKNTWKQALQKAAAKSIFIKDQKLEIKDFINRLDKIERVLDAKLKNLNKIKYNC